MIRHRRQTRAAGAAWKLTRMLADLSAELAGLGLSLCTEIGKCAWVGIGIDDLVLGFIINTEDDALMT